MKMVLLKCSSPLCDMIFERRETEAARNNRLGRLQYCSKSCHAKCSPLMDREHKSEDALHLNSANRLDEYSPFRQHLRRIKLRNKDYSVTLDDLKRIWESQNGKCVFTGWDLDFTLSSKAEYTFNPRTASLDRIDNSRGYHPDNVQWVCGMANFAKHSFEDQDLLDFALAIVNNRML